LYLSKGILALGMTIRHWTGSSKLISLLHGLRHCVSHPTVDAAAVVNTELNKNSIVPKVHAMVILDNSDFVEETTHNTNGIIVQQISEDILVCG
jgi:hypothetical protein